MTFDLVEKKVFTDPNIGRSCDLALAKDEPWTLDEVGVEFNWEVGLPHHFSGGRIWLFSAFTFLLKGGDDWMDFSSPDFFFFGGGWILS